MSQRPAVEIYQKEPNFVQNGKSYVRIMFDLNPTRFNISVECGVIQICPVGTGVTTECREIRHVGT